MEGQDVVWKRRQPSQQEGARAEVDGSDIPGKSAPGTAKHQELEELNAENENRKLKRRIAAAVRARSSEDDSRNTLVHSQESMEKKGGEVELDPPPLPPERSNTNPL